MSSEIKNLEKSIRMLEAISEITRNQIVGYFFIFKELNANDLIKLTGKVNSTIIHHLQILQKRGVISESKVIWKERYYKLSEEFIEIYQNQQKIYYQLKGENPARALSLYRLILDILGKSTGALLNRYSSYLTIDSDPFTVHDYNGSKQYDILTHGLIFKKETYENKIRPLLDEILILMEEDFTTFDESEVKIDEIMDSVIVRIFSLPMKKSFPKDLDMNKIGPK